MNIRGVKLREIPVVAAALPTGSVILVVGASDTGKSTFVREIAASLVNDRATGTAIVDADIGQTELGLPACIALVAVQPGGWPENVRGLKPTASAFVGATSPVRHVLQWAVGISLLVRQAQSMAGIGRIIIDTPGYVAGATARAMLETLFDLVTPALIVGLARGDELGPLLGVLDHLSAPPVVVCAESSPAVQRKSRSARTARRAARFNAHFLHSKRHDLLFDNIALTGSRQGTGVAQPPHVRKFIGESLGAECLHAEKMPEGGLFVVTAQPIGRTSGMAAIEEHFRTRGVHATAVNSYDGLLCGLYDQWKCLIDVALIEEIDFAARRLTIRTPLALSSGIAQIRLGSLRLRPDGKELGESPPGSV